MLFLLLFSELADSLMVLSDYHFGLLTFFNLLLLGSFHLFFMIVADHKLLLFLSWLCLFNFLLRRFLRQLFLILNFWTFFY